MDALRASGPLLKPLTLTLDLNVAQRLADLAAWTAAWQSEDHRLHRQIQNLNPHRRADVLLGSQIGSLRRQLALHATRQPLCLDPEAVRGVSFTRLRQHLAPQYARLSAAERRLWLTNLSFVLTPTLQALIHKLDDIRRYRSLGQARCFLLGGVSGVGKSSILNWYAINHLPTVQDTRNHVPISQCQLESNTDVS